jgi:hypothetical protein
LSPRSRPETFIAGKTWKWHTQADGSELLRGGIHYKKFHRKAWGKRNAENSTGELQEDALGKARMQGEVTRARVNRVSGLSNCRGQEEVKRELALCLPLSRDPIAKVP